MKLQMPVQLFHQTRDRQEHLDCCRSRLDKVEPNASYAALVQLLQLRQGYVVVYNRDPSSIWTTLAQRFQQAPIIESVGGRLNDHTATKTGLPRYLTILSK